MYKRQPLAVASVIGLDIGTSIVYGLVTAAVSTAAAWVYCMMFLDKKPKSFFTSTEENKRTEKAESSVREEDMPGFTAAILPILIPIVLIILNSVCSLILPEESVLLKAAGFVGDKNIALVIGIVSAILLLKKKLPEGETFGAIGEALKTAGPVIFITAAGGALAKVVDATGTGQMFADALAVSGLPVVLIPFLITALSKDVYKRQGCWTWANALPGSPAIPNVIASKSLGTSATSDLAAGIIFCGILMYVLCFLYLEWQAARYKDVYKRQAFLMAHLFAG